MKHIHTYESFLNESAFHAALAKAKEKGLKEFEFQGKKYPVKEEALEESELEEGGYFKGLSKSTSSKKKAQMRKQAEMPDDDPKAYKELPGDVKGKKLLKTSKHTKSYHELYGNK